MNQEHTPWFFHFVGYNAKEITDIIVKEDEVYELNVNLSPASTGLEEHVVEVSAKKNTEEALLSIQKNQLG